MTTAAHIIGALLRFLFAVVRLVVTLAVREQMAALVIFVHARRPGAVLRGWP